MRDSRRNWKYPLFAFFTEQKNPQMKSPDGMMREQKIKRAEKSPFSQPTFSTLKSDARTFFPLEAIPQSDRIPIGAGAFA